MGVQTSMALPIGETRDLYIRLNNVEVSNHGVKSLALFRAFLSEDLFNQGANYIWEQYVEFDADVTQPIWPQAYAALKGQPTFAAAVDVLTPEQIKPGVLEANVG